MLNTSEIIVSKTHIEPLAEDGYIIYKLGYISPVVDGKREARMIWGNERRPNSGASAFVYVAYASDASGTGFTMTFNAALDYIAIKSTTIAIASPVVTDFTGLWKKYKGNDGAGVPSGGTTNQKLVKNSNTDYDTKWINDTTIDTTVFAQGGKGTYAPTSLFSGTIGFDLSFEWDNDSLYVFNMVFRDAAKALLASGMYRGYYSNLATPRGVLEAIAAFSSSYVTAIELSYLGTKTQLKVTFLNLPANYRFTFQYMKAV